MNNGIPNDAHREQHQRGQAGQNNNPEIEVLENEINDVLDANDG